MLSCQQYRLIRSVLLLRDFTNNTVRAFTFARRNQQVATLTENETPSRQTAVPTNTVGGRFVFSAEPCFFILGGSKQLTDGLTTLGRNPDLHSN